MYIFSFILHIIYNCATTIWFSTIMHSYPHYPQSYPHFSDSLCIVCILSNILHSSVISCFCCSAFPIPPAYSATFPRLYRITNKVGGTPSPHTFRSTPSTPIFQRSCKEIAACNTEYPRRKHADFHGIFRIPAARKTFGRAKLSGQISIAQMENVCKSCTVLQTPHRTVKNTQPSDGPESNNVMSVKRIPPYASLTFSAVPFRLLFSPAPMQRRSLSPSQARSQSRNIGKPGNTVCHGILRRSQPFQTLPSGLTQKFTDLKHPIFQYRLEYRSLRFSDHIFLWTHTARCRDAERIIFFDNNTTMTSADTILAISVASAAPHYTDSSTINQDRIAANVNHIHDKAGVHTDLTVSNTSEKCRPGVIHTEKRIRYRRDQKINLSRIHHICFNLSENCTQ